MYESGCDTRFLLPDCWDIYFLTDVFLVFSREIYTTVEQDRFGRMGSLIYVKKPSY